MEKITKPYWNFRVVKEKSNPKHGNSFRIIEVHYTKKGKIRGWCNRVPFGKTPKKLKKDFKLMLKAFDKPILKEIKNEKLIKL